MRAKLTFPASAIAALLLVAACGNNPSARAGIVAALPPTSDANISGTTINDPPASGYGLVINIFSNTRALIEFDTSSLPQSALLDAVTLQIGEFADANPPCIVNIEGFGDNGIITASDATAAATLIGSYSATALGGGRHSIDLNTSVLQSLVGTNQYLALRLESGSSATNTSIGALEVGGAYGPPSLSATYHVPEPSAIALIAAGSLLSLVRIRRTTSRR